MVKQIKITSKALWDIVLQQYCGQGMLRYLVLCFYLRGGVRLPTSPATRLRLDRGISLFFGLCHAKAALQ